MCSVADDENVEENFIRSETPLNHLCNEDCKKCGILKACIILRKKDAYCTKCFIACVVHKFRASLGKSKLIRPGHKVLVGFSGDAASCALLNLVKTGLSESTHKKLRFEPFVLYIDDGVITLTSKEERNKRNCDIKNIVDSEKIPTFFTSLCDILKQEPNFMPIDKEMEIDEELDSQIKKMFMSVSSLTAKQDLLRKFKRKLLLDCAKELNCSFILVADTATKLASSLLSSVSLGGGSHLASDVGFCDSRDDKVKILRPMRDFMSDDLNNFIEVNSISHLAHVSLANDNNPYASIQSLTKKFVNDLQQSFPATISTVLRTGEKMENKIKTTDSEEDKCALCMSILDTQATPCSALDATEFSRKISNLGPDTSECSSDEARPKCADCNCKPSEDLPTTRLEIEQFLCYSCRLLIKDVKDVKSLPRKMLTSIKIKKSLLDTRNKIQDFLL